FALAAERVASIDECAREAWFDSERLIEIGNGPFVALLFVPHQTALIVGTSVREPQSDGLIKVDERSIRLAMSAPQPSPIAVQSRVVRIEADCHLVVCECARQVALAAPCVATVVMGERAARP